MNRGFLSHTMGSMPHDRRLNVVQTAGTVHAREFKKLCNSVFLFIGLCVYLSVCLSVCRSVSIYGGYTVTSVSSFVFFDFALLIFRCGHASL